MKIFVTGAAGQLGLDVMKELQARGIEAVGSDLAVSCGDRWTGMGLSPDAYRQLDITDPSTVDQVLNDLHPDAVIHCAAWTAVDLAEDPNNLRKVRAINGEGTAHIASACKRLDCAMMYISTDYVFSGQGTQPWQADSKAFAPLNVYGQTKLEGEQAVASTLRKFFIVRIAWVFGPHGNNFVKTMINLSKKRSSLRVVNDQIGTPTYTPDLARLLVDMIMTDRYGCYHATNEGGYISWYDFAKAIFEAAGIEMEVVPVTTEEYGLSAAKRPSNSRLDKHKLRECGFIPLPDWQDALRRYLALINKENRDENGTLVP